MTLKEIVEKLSGLNIVEVRSSTEDSHELVFTNEKIDDWDKIFTEMLGPAVKPRGVKPTKEDQSITDKYGGIYNNQVLYKKEFDNAVVLAMFWPWQDDVHTTLKIVLLKK